MISVRVPPAPSEVPGHLEDLTLVGEGASLRNVRLTTGWTCVGLRDATSFIPEFYDSVSADVASGILEPQTVEGRFRPVISGFVTAQFATEEGSLTLNVEITETVENCSLL